MHHGWMYTGMEDLYLDSSGRVKGGSKQAKKIKGNRGVCGCWEPLSEDIWGISQNHNLRNFEEFRGDISFNFKDF